jgi:hypothetical protein
VAFYAYYWNFISDYDAKQAVIAADIKEKKIERLKAEADARAAAIQTAIDEQKLRKQQRIEREAMERKQKDDKENARLIAEKADQEAQKLSHQVEKLTGDVKVAKEEIEKIQAENKRAVEDEAFLKTYVAMAVENRDKLSEVLTKIDAADKAAAKAALEAAAAAKK